MRGNVDTRLRKLADGQFDAIVIALAGLQRLDRAGEAGGVLDELVPAAGQGALALEARDGARSTRRSPPSAIPRRRACVTAERELARALDATCNTPVGAHARQLDEGRCELRAWVGLPDGSAWVRDRSEGEAAGLGRAVAQRLLSAGAGELLRRAELEGARRDRVPRRRRPGRPGLMTARALELIAAADVIVYDRLIPATALDGAREDALLLYAGKEGGGPSIAQDEIDGC